MSVGGPSNLGTLLIRRLDTALSVAASQQSQIVNAGKSDAILQLADATRIAPLHNEGGRPLPEIIDKALAQTERRGRPVEDARLQSRPLPQGPERPSTETSSTPSAPTTLGHAAKTILALLSRFPGQAPPVAGRAPLVLAGTAASSTPAAAGAAPTVQASASNPGASSVGPSGPAASGEVGPALIARALGLAVGQSGLFYESHLRELASGARTAAQLKLEPQGQLRAPATPAQAGSMAHAAAAHAGSSPPVQHGVPTPDNMPAEARSHPPTATGQAGQSPASVLPGLHPDTHLVVRQQLETLATQAFNWHGEAWPDAPLDWEISRRDEHGASDETGTHWATRLCLSLPVLGEIEARLSLHGSQVVMRLVAPQSAQTLKQHDPALRAAFQESGLTLSQLSIQDEEEA